MTIKEEILKLPKKWRTYDEIGEEVKKVLPSSYETIARRVRELVESGKLDSKKVKGKAYNKYRRA